MRTVLITGATSGFGKLLTEAFLKQGDRVIATGRNLLDRREIFEKDREIYQDKLVELNMDVTKKSEIQDVINTVREKNLPLDILINNAGHGLFGALEDLEEEDIRHQMEVNFFGTVLVTKMFLPFLRGSRGKIFNFSSVFGFMGFPHTALYCASKYAVEGLTESLRGELSPFGVQVCLIEPGGYRTNFGSNIRWVQKTSTYEVQISNYRELHRKISLRKPQQPMEVALGILELSKKSSLPMRKVFGRDGNLSYVLKRFLPSFFYFGLMDMVFKKIFLRGHK
jgi:NAD(P)-dependent dehydrogenase (short-subunit alcohol dehydrogenase family)